MNVNENRDAANGTPSGALMSALTTEHYTLQAARSSTVVEANGRSLLFLSAVSGATVALALVAQLDRLGQTFLIFALSILPALLALGLTSYARLADLAVHDAFYARGVGRIRAFFFTIDPLARQYWLLSAGDDPHAVMRQAGQRHSRWHSALALRRALLHRGRGRGRHVRRVLPRPGTALASFGPVGTDSLPP